MGFLTGIKVLAANLSDKDRIFHPNTEILIGVNNKDMTSKHHANLQRCVMELPSKYKRSQSQEAADKDKKKPLLCKKGLF